MNHAPAVPLVPTLARRIARRLDAAMCAGAAANAAVSVLADQHRAGQRADSAAAVRDLESAVRPTFAIQHAG